MDAKENLDLKLINKLDYYRREKDNKHYLALINKSLEDVQIKESQEKMLFLPKYLSKKIFIDIEERFKKKNGLYLREGIIGKLNKAQNLLPKKYHFKVVHAFRSEEIVWELYHEYFQKAKRKYPDLTDKEIDLRIRNILAMPDDPMPPGHMTGGAVDILLTKKDGNRVKLKIDPQKVPKDEQNYIFYEGLPKDIARNRRMLYETLSSVGFNNYPREFWHYSYGDPYWAVRRKKKIAIYGIPEPKLFIK